jgi:hypothetical protein
MARKRATPCSQTKSRPEPAQLKAIDRLLAEKQCWEAICKGQPALRQFPAYGGLHREQITSVYVRR